MMEMLRLHQKHKAIGFDKKAFLRDAAKIPGIYVPSLYDVTYKEDGTIAAVTPKDGAPKTVRKRIIEDLNAVYYRRPLWSPIPR